jgi:glycosyltransferase involved in cell wall biosynthesis
LTQSTAVRDRIRSLYGIDAEVLPGPLSIAPAGSHPIAGIEPGFFLCVARLLPYKNVDAVVAAFSRLPERRLIVVGTGPEELRLRRAGPPNVRLVGTVSDEQLQWLYERSAGLVAASYEDYGLTPLEAAACGKPTAALRWGGYLDTVIDGKTGLFFDAPTAPAIADAVARLAGERFDPSVLQAHAGRYSEATFISRLRSVVAREVQTDAVRVTEEALAPVGLS